MTLVKKLTIKQAADLAGVSPTIVYGWIASSRLAHYRLGAIGRRGRILIDPTDLSQFIEGMKVTAAAELPRPTPLPRPKAGKFKHIRVS